jgi:hypothetical protein
MVAPGGRKSGLVVEEASVHSGHTPQIGTSVAAAYAAGVVARSIWVLEQDGKHLETAELLAELKGAANRDFPSYEAIGQVEYGEGLIRTLEPRTPDTAP